MTQFITRAYNSIELTDFNTVIKTSDDNKLKDEINYYRSLKGHYSFFFPKIYRSNCSQKPYKLEIEYYAYKNIGEYFLNEISNPEVFWSKTLNKLFNIIQLFKQNKNNITKEEIEKFCQEMFIDKTIKEYNKLKTNFDFFSNLSKSDIIILNETEYYNFEKIWISVQQKINDLIKRQNNFNLIHGDMCFSNILLGYTDEKSEVSIKFIDPRGSFGEKGIYGSSIYDYAKLMHSIDGNYEAIINDKFGIKIKDNNFFYTIINNKKNESICKKIFKEKLSKQDYLDAKLVQGLIYIGMCARHYDSHDRQVVMYLTGIRLLNEVLNEDMC